MAIFIDGKQARGSLVVEGDLTMPLPTYKTSSGSIATFETDMTENLISCVADIVAQQASGTPSPSTPLPISGVSAVNVFLTGKNIFNKTITIVTGKVIGSNGSIVNNAPYCYCDYIPVHGNTDYVFSGSLISATAYNSVAFYDSSKTFISRYMPNIGVPAQFTTPNNACYIRANFITQELDLDTVQLEQGTVATAYEPFGTTATCNLGDTYYGGSVDVVTGKIIKTYKIVDLGSLTWERKTDGAIPYFRTTIPDSTMTISVRNFMCTNYENVPFGNIYSQGQNQKCTSYIGGIFIISDNDYSDAPSFTTAMSGVYLCYELATPTTAYASNSLEIPTINGTNNLFADTGDTTAKYILSVGEALRQAV